MCFMQPLLLLPLLSFPLVLSPPVQLILQQLPGRMLLLLFLDYVNKVKNSFALGEAFLVGERSQVPLVLEMQCHMPHIHTSFPEHMRNAHSAFLKLSKLVLLISFKAHFLRHCMFSVVDLATTVVDLFPIL